jgi:hypothetical protein
VSEALLDECAEGRDISSIVVVRCSVREEVVNGVGVKHVLLCESKHDLAKIPDLGRNSSASFLYTL